MSVDAECVLDFQWTTATVLDQPGTRCNISQELYSVRDSKVSLVNCKVREVVSCLYW